jgi:hypothetical protein
VEAGAVPVVATDLAADVVAVPHTPALHAGFHANL